MNALAPSPATALPATIPARRKLLPSASFSVVFGIGPIEAIELVDSGVLWPSFNLAAQDSGRRLIRVWRGAIEGYQPGEKAPKADVADVITAVLPPLGVAAAAFAAIRASDLAFRWSVSNITTKNLLESGKLREVGRHNLNETPRVSYASAHDFLQRRVL